jgi:hypothetical protein
MTFNRKRVMLVGELVGVPREGIQAQSMQAIQARSIELDRPEDAAAFAAEVRALAVTGSQPWVTILCRFADSTGVTPHDVGYFNTLMGSSYLDRYWREVSYDDINLTGSAVFGWYNLPQPKSHYVDNTGAKLDLLANDCTAVADADVFFPNFTGINLMFNDTLDGFAWGGSNQLNKDGQSKHYGITWIPVWGAIRLFMGRDERQRRDVRVLGCHLRLQRTPYHLVSQGHTWVDTVLAQVCACAGSQRDHRLRASRATCVRQ